MFVDFVKAELWVFEAENSLDLFGIWISSIFYPLAQRPS